MYCGFIQIKDKIVNSQSLWDQLVDCLYVAGGQFQGEFTLWDMPVYCRRSDVYCQTMSRLSPRLYTGIVNTILYHVKPLGGFYCFTFVSKCWIKILYKWYCLWHWKVCILPNVVFTRTFLPAKLFKTYKNMYLEMLSLELKFQTHERFDMQKYPLIQYLSRLSFIIQSW